jgi:serine/threonine protein kinase
VFGTVFKAKCLETNEILAVKKILIDKTFKSRELELLEQSTHPNIINLKDHFLE